MVVVQPCAMYFFLRLLGFGFFVSGGLSALAAMLVGFGIYTIQSRAAALAKSLWTFFAQSAGWSGREAAVTSRVYSDVRSGWLPSLTPNVRPHHTP